MWKRSDEMTMRGAVVMAVAMAAVLVPTGSGRGCNPDFPESMIGKTDAGLLSAPPADFVTEVMRIEPGEASGVRWHSTWADEWMPEEARPSLSDEIDVADIVAALAKAGASGEEQKKVAGAVEAWRIAVRTGKGAGVLPALPLEFALYEEGAALYHAKDFAGARGRWEKLLALPAEGRAVRSVWAAYMIGRVCGDGDPAQAATWFVKTRQLVKQGFADTNDLARASLGWEARARWKMGERPRAMELYLEQAHAREPLAVWSLRDCAAELLSLPAGGLAECARDRVTRQVVTAFLVARGGNLFYGMQNPKFDYAQKSAAWLAAARAAGVKEMAGAERLAWLAYQQNDMEGAGRWLELGSGAGEKTALGQWIRAKLYMRAGNMEKAAACLGRAAQGFPKNEEWVIDLHEDYSRREPWSPAAHANGELALIKLSRAQFVDAMDLLYRGKFWEDAAHIAEHVLTPEELMGYVDRQWRAEKGRRPTDEELARGPQRADQMRALLARRLTRIGRWKEARAYFTPEMQGVLDAYIAGIRTGGDVKRAKAERAAGLWEAAQIARTRGMELLATELEPDVGIYEGNFSSISIAGRLAAATQPGRALAPVSKEEVRRLKAEGPPDAPEKKWHYRYTACDHAWAAAQLLPDNSELLVKVLMEAGGWVKAQDPKAADKFYKALVVRCAGTAVGQEAARVRWFPK